MKKIKVSEATPKQLSWLVAKCEGALRNWPNYTVVPAYSTDPALGQPILERERITIRFWDNEDFVTAYMPLRGRDHSPWYHGDTALIAAMRCYVAFRMGEEVEVPDELA